MKPGGSRWHLSRPAWAWELTGWLLAALLCVGLPLGMGYLDLALVGAVTLALAAWLVRRGRKENRGSEGDT